MNLLDFYNLGARIQYCIRVEYIVENNITVPIHGDGYIVSALNSIKSILEKHSMLNVVQKQLKNYVDYLSEQYPEKDEKIDLEEAISLRTKAYNWHALLKDDIEKIVVFKAFTDGCQLNPDKLCEGAKTFFQNKIWKKLPKIIREDFEESAKCLLTQSWTASGLMSMRALESGVKTYYEKITANPSEKKTLGAMIHKLKDDSNADSKLIGYLDYLKDIRNDLAHPNERIEQFEAEQAFQHAIQILSIVYG